MTRTQNVSHEYTTLSSPAVNGRRDETHVPPYMTWFLTISSRAADALFSSIQSGWNQWSCGIKPKWISASVRTLTRLPRVTVSEHKASANLEEETKKGPTLTT